MKINEANIKMPTYDIQKMREKTKHAPEWLHLGAGNLFRAYLAALQEKLLNQGLTQTGIIVAEGYDYEIIDEVFIKNDLKSLLVTLKHNGQTDNEMIYSVAEALKFDQQFDKDYARLIDVIKNPSLKMVSFTITEKGYNLYDDKGKYLKAIESDINNPIGKASSYLGKVVHLLYERYKSGAYPLALVSMDNVSQNGKKVYDAITTLANEWYKSGYVDIGFYEYVSGNKISYPWTVIDKITPRPNQEIADLIEDIKLYNKNPIITGKGSHIAGFVNAEEKEYLVIEDVFSNGKIPLDKVGVIYTDRNTVTQFETMKVTTCLNPLHTALAVFGCLLSYDKIHETMQDETLVKLIKQIGYKEGLPVVVHPKIIDPKDFLDEVVHIRFPNPFMPDTPQRIATDTSQKLSIRFLNTIKSYVNKSQKVDQLIGIPLVIAGWLRYLMGINDQLQPFELSPDPLLNQLLPQIKAINFDCSVSEIKTIIQPILTDPRIFDLDLYKVGLGHKIENYFIEMLDGKDAVRNLLERELDIK